ncbi:MAG: XRE family transcriptional regulator [Thermomicrobiales bacterium]|nr:XRE family transcriptional regulator [Thermomicrobiales bacterium]
MDDLHIREGSDNVFADFGYPDAEDWRAKTRLVMQIWTTVEARGLTQRQTAEILGVDQPKVSLLMNGKLRGFSVSKLMEFLNALDQDVEIIVRPKAAGQEHGRTTVRLVAEEEPAYVAEG